MVPGDGWVIGVPTPRTGVLGGVSSGVSVGVWVGSWLGLGCGSGWTIVGVGPLRAGVLRIGGADDGVGLGVARPGGIVLTGVSAGNAVASGA
jgi:hypothetical protein